MEEETKISDPITQLPKKILWAIYYLSLAKQKPSTTYLFPSEYLFFKGRENAFFGRRLLHYVPAHRVTYDPLFPKKHFPRRRCQHKNEVEEKFAAPGKEGEGEGENETRAAHYFPGK